jgi:hypothetical protein
MPPARRVGPTVEQPQLKSYSHLHLTLGELPACKYTAGGRRKKRGVAKKREFSHGLTVDNAKNFKINMR